MTANADLFDEPPPSNEERVLCDFFERALDLLRQGRPVHVADLLAATPKLVKRGTALLAELEVLLQAGRDVRFQSSLFRSDLAELTAEYGSADTSEPPHEPDEPPTPFPGEFRLRQRLGSGSFGTVWLADDLLLRRPVALKTIRAPAPGPSNARRLDLLREEARLLASVDHPHVVRVHALREAPVADGSGLFLVLQFVPGGSLAERVRREGPLSWQLAARYAAEVGEGLREVHRLGIVHRDVKPANILWDAERDRAVLTDFGVSKRLAAAGTIGGTPFYMPPEAFTGVVSPAHDVFGLAASLFWMMTGSVPFPAPTWEQVLARVERGLPDPDHRCSCMPRPLERLLRAGLAADPERRPPLESFVEELRGQLNQLLADSILLAPAPSRQFPVQLRLTVSRETRAHGFVPVATTQPVTECFTRDLKRVPREPERVDVCTGDRLRLEAEADRAGHLLVFNVGPTGNLNLLQPERARPAPVQPGRPLHIVDLELTPPAGRERLVALWTRSARVLRADELLSVAEGADLSLSAPARATRDVRRVQQALEQLRPEEWHAAILEINHRAPVEESP